MSDSRDGDHTLELRETLVRWLALDRSQQTEVWDNVGFDLFLGTVKLNIALLDRMQEVEKRLEELGTR